ncbi:MAG TPA: diaminopimelate epimerase [Cyanobacteria bacterium UBA8530]|nr:diaminopimelate epimerase [Cyanobacteria bacterium UBA8530]
MNLPFLKMHGCGNDFIVIDLLSFPYPVEWEKVAPKLCHRQFGIGADGLLLLLPSSDLACDYKMRVINSDGSEAQMCGNGIRVFARYLREKKISEKKEFSIETLAGTIKPVIVEDEVFSVRVDMGRPVLERPEIPMTGEGRAIAEKMEVEGKEYFFTAVSMGNPHCVIFTEEDPAEIELEGIGKKIETSPLFPEKTNVEFARLVGRKNIEMRVWERGAGLTLACGTGACATLVAAVLNGKSERRATVVLPGGSLEIEWAENDHLYMTGPAASVFSGHIPLSSLS